jgi:pimeloyl-ACP methyl ester carboxylesterase
MLFSGLAADESIFWPQKRAFPGLVVPRWIAPLPRETLANYCERWAASLAPIAPRLIGGASFGGIIALEMAKHLQPAAVILIGSLRRREDLPWYIRAIAPARTLVPWVPWRALQSLAAGVNRPWLAKRFPHSSGVMRQFSNADCGVLSWSLQQLLAWQGTAPPNCPIYQIHGSHDRILPLRKGAERIANGGHIISLTHAKEVNAFLHEIMDRHSAVGPETTNRPLDSASSTTDSHSSNHRSG